MNKKICVVTGATSGIGKEAAKLIAREGFFVVLAFRSLEKAENVCADIKKQSETQSSCCIELDLSSFRSIERFADEFTRKFHRLDVLINNAGTICDRHHETQQGFEMTMGVNYLGHCYLTELLLPVIKKTDGARIINVSSIVGINSKMGDEILDFYGIRHGMHAYTASKLAQILYTADLAERLGGCDVTVNALHPGIIATNIWTGEGLLMRATKPFMKYVCPPAVRGAKNILHLALSPDLKGISGSVFSKKKQVSLKNSSKDEDLRKKLIKATRDAISEATECKKSIAI